MSSLSRLENLLKIHSMLLTGTQKHSKLFIFTIFNKEVETEEKEIVVCWQLDVVTVNTEE